MIERKPAQYVTIDLPAPISTNKLWRPIVRGGKPAIVSTKEYLEWIGEAGWMLNAQRPGMVEGPYCITMKISRKSRADLDNVKAVSDLLQTQGVIENDRLAERVVIERADIDGMQVMVVSTKAGAA